MIDLKRRLLSGPCVVLGLAWSAAASAQTVSPPADAPMRVVQARAKPASPASESRSDAGQRAAPVDQDTTAGSTKAVSEVVVTAIRTTTVQKTAAAVTAYTDERRNLLGVETGRDIANLTPSTQLQGNYLAIRGVGRYEDPGQGLDPGIAVHVDGVYTDSPSYLNQPDFLTDRIEVLRGPQSIFGRNSTGGTVNVYSKRPTNDFHADVRTGYTSQEYGYVSAAVSGPLVDTLKGRLAYSASDLRDGPQTNTAGDRPNPGTGQTRLFEAQLQWDPTPDLDIWTRYQNYSANARASYGVSAGTNLLGPYFTDVPVNYTTGLYYGLAVNPQFGIDPNSNPSRRDKTYVAVDDPGHSSLRDDHTFTINAAWDLHWATLKYIGGYSQYTSDIEADADGTARATLLSPGGRVVPSYYTTDSTQTKKWYSNEIILTSPDQNRLRWLVGGYQYAEQYVTDFSVRDPNANYLANPYFSFDPATGVLSLPAPANPTRSFYSQLTKLNSYNQAIYGQLDFDLTSHVQLTGAVRYNWDQRYGFNGVRQVFDLYGIYGDFGVPQAALDVTPNPSVASTRHSFSDYSGKLGAEWHPDASLNAYVSIARGYKSGGFDLGNFRPIPVVQPEILTDYEGGVKKTFGKSLLVDAAVYYYDYSNLQVPIVVQTSVINPITGAPSPLFVSTLANAQRTHSYGFELETVYSPLENLHFTLSYSAQNAKFDRFTSPTPGGLIQDPAGIAYANLKGNTVPQVPGNKLSVIPNYVWHTGRGDLSLSAIGTFVDSEYYSIFNTDRYRAPSYYNLDLRAVFQPTNAHWTAILYARNITDSDQFIYYAASGVFTNQAIYTLSERRAVGGELQFRF